jgi:hypothetical protein
MKTRKENLLRTLIIELTHADQILFLANLTGNQNQTLYSKVAYYTKITLDNKNF